MADVESRPMLMLQEPDAHGQAALLLAESTLHQLVELGVMDKASAFEVVETASAVKREVAADAGESVGRMKASLTLLSNIGKGFSAEVIPI